MGLTYTIPAMKLFGCNLHYHLFAIELVHQKRITWRKKNYFLLGGGERKKTASVFISIEAVNIVFIDQTNTCNVNNIQYTKKERIEKKKHCTLVQ